MEVQTEDERIEQLRRIEQKKREYFDKIEGAVFYMNTRLLGELLDEIHKNNIDAVGVEYSRLGNDRYGFFYNLLDSFYSRVCSARGDKSAVSLLVANFRACASLLLKHGILPDMKTMTTWNAICVGTLKDPFKFRMFEDNQGGVKESMLNNGGSKSDYVIDIYNMEYPKYMPYLEYSPEQRLMFDEFVFFNGLLEEELVPQGRMEEIRSSYKTDSIWNDARELCFNADESEIKENADLDEMNIKLAMHFDFFTKVIHAAMKEKFSLRDFFKHDRAMMERYFDVNRYEIGDRQVIGAPIYLYKSEKEMEKVKKQTHSIFKVAVMCPSLVKQIDPVTVRAMVRMGAALFTPMMMSRAHLDCQPGVMGQGVSYKELTEMKEEYYRFKKSIFVPDKRPFMFKPIPEIAEIPLPKYLGYLRGKPLYELNNEFGMPIDPGTYDMEYNMKEIPRPWSDKQDSFSWLQLFAEYAYPDGGDSLGQISATEVKKIFGITDLAESYEERAIASIAEEFDVPDDYTGGRRALLSALGHYSDQPEPER